MTPQLNTAAAAPSEQFQPPIPGGFAGYQLGNSWRMQFADADGIPLNMVTLEIIDFGAISYKEIFQNVKTILATALFSAALERTLGVDQNIVDLPENRASEATVAVLTALYQWEQRVQVIKISFEADVINGHLICNLQLKVSNVMFGTNIAYNQSNLFPSPTRVQQGLPPMQEPVLIPGPAGEPGRRGSLWFTGPDDPDPDNLPADVLPNDLYLNTTSGDVFQFLIAPGSGGSLMIARRKL
jgi:uncharacterized protein